MFVHLVNSELWQRVTGERIPETPVDARTYSQYGYPWFSLYDEKLGDIASSDVLEGVKSVKGMDEDKGFKPQQDDESVEIADGQVHGITPTVLAHAVADGDW